MWYNLFAYLYQKEKERVYIVKKFLLFYSECRNLLRMVGVITAIIVGEMSLPPLVLFIGILPIAFSVFLEVCRHKGGWSNGKLSAYFLVDFAAVVLNMLYLSIYSVATISIWETLFVGTFLDMIICTVCFIFAAQKSSYAEVKQH